VCDQRPVLPVGFAAAIGIFAKPGYVEQYRGTDRICGGIIYTSYGWEQLYVQLTGVVVIWAFTAATSFTLFFLLRHFGRLRVERETEIAGIDNIDHGGPAYPDFVIRAHD
jgi:ammonium transporter, Amt family